MIEKIPEALLFDVFGTVFDWRSTVVAFLYVTFQERLKVLSEEGNQQKHDADQVSNGDGNRVPKISGNAEIVEFPGEDFWKKFAVEWRGYYVEFVKKYGGESVRSTRESAFFQNQTTVDELHFSSLSSLLAKYNLDGFYDPSTTRSISQIWHYLKPWPDSAEGMSSLRNLTTVCTLSNGNVNLLKDLSKNGGVRFDLILSGQLFGRYKPDESVYVGACELLGIGDSFSWDFQGKAEVEKGSGTKEEKNEQEEIKKWKKSENGKVAMVAAHIKDLAAARSFGLKTIYIERPDEDNVARDEYKSKGENWVDMWIHEDEGGLLEVARKLKGLQKNHTVGSLDSEEVKRACEKFKTLNKE